MRKIQADLRASLHRIIEAMRPIGMPRVVLTSSFRLTLLYAALFGASALVLAALVWWIATGYVAGQIDSAVTTEIAEERADAGGTLAGLQAVIRAQAGHASPAAYYLLQNRAGQVLAGNLPAMATVDGIREWTLPSGSAVRGRGVAAPEGGFLFVGLAASDLRELRHAIGYAFLWVVAGTLVLAAIGGTVMSFGVLGRVEAISRASRRIIAGDLGQRIALRGTNDEFDHLAASLNAMLDRIQVLMEGMRQVSSDIAHDLRTPLSRHRQRLELALLDGGTEHDLRATLASSIVDIDAILDTFGALLRIARLESRTDPPPFTEVDLGAIAQDVTDAYRAVAEERQQSLDCIVDSEVAVPGNRELLAQLVANLIENGLRHGQCDTAMRILVTMQDGAVVLCVSDDGPGIPAAFHQAVFRPFYRLETSRDVPGTGLGLSLVAAIAQMHDARVTLADNNPGLAVQVVFGRPPLPESDAEPEWLRQAQRWLHRRLPEWYARQATRGVHRAWHGVAYAIARFRQGRGTVAKPRNADQHDQDAR
ncbi:MAG: HAMP domain-containing histidine kinase [Rhodospirillales bacterium]|nr:HAMP domain-containing histidine kinase [Rhodospirillales bacterium]